MKTLKQLVLERIAKKEQASRDIQKMFSTTSSVTKFQKQWEHAR